MIDKSLVVWQANFDDYGRILSENKTGFEMNVRFPGQYHDRESGLYYNLYRYYDSYSGRYISSDPIGLQGGLNTYLYANANPLNYVDPLGLYVCGISGGLTYTFNNRFTIGNTFSLSVDHNLNVGAVHSLDAGVSSTPGFTGFVRGLASFDKGATVESLEGFAGSLSYGGGRYSASHSKTLDGYTFHEAGFGAGKPNVSLTGAVGVEKACSGNC